jgi:hypothetical protein
MSIRNSRYAPVILASIGITLVALLSISVFNLIKKEDMRSIPNQGEQNVQSSDEETGSVTDNGLQTAGISWREHVDTEYGISFEAPGGWSVGEFVDAEVGYRELNIIDPSLALIVITKDPNPEDLSPEQWFEKVKSKYDPDFIQIIGRTAISGNSTLFLGQPMSCETFPMIVAFLPIDSSMFTVTQYERASRAEALELKHLLETFSIVEKDERRNLIPGVFFQYPATSADFCQ